MVVLTRSNKVGYIFHRTRSSQAKACTITYDKWKALPIPSKVLIFPNAVKKKCTSISAQSHSTPQQSPKKNDTMLPTDTTVPLPLPLKREMYTHAVRNAAKSPTNFEHYFEMIAGNGDQ
jgi:hypothetical protein